MKQPIKINLLELLEKGIITTDIAEAIQQFYEQKKQPNENRVLTIFGILGAALIGLGIILIVAHNWDNLSRATKTILAFSPLIFGQSLVGFTLFKKKENNPWREGSATFLFFGVGTCIAMISQVYHIEGELHAFLFTWILLCLPLVYLLRSSMVSLLLICFASWYAFAYRWETIGKPIPFGYLAILFALTPYFYQLWKSNRKSNSFTFHLWFWVISLTFCLSTFSKNVDSLLWVMYAGLLGVFFLIGNSEHFKSQRLLTNPLLVFGALGSIFIFLTTSFGEIMRDIQQNNWNWSELLASAEFYSILLLFGLNIYLLAKTKLPNQLVHTHPMQFSAILFLLSFLLGQMTGSPIISNLFLLWAGLFYILRGQKQQHLGWLNFGLLILTILIICRFFDVDLTFVARGILFILLGIGFLFANIRLIRTRNNQQVS